MMSTTRKPPVQQLRVLLIKDGYKTMKSILKDVDTLFAYQLSESLPFKGKLYIRGQPPRPPKWQSFIKPHIQGDLGQLFNANTAAVLIIAVKKRRFAFTFGYGRSLLNPEAWERDFGLKVVLNRVDPESLRSIDCRTFEELTLQTRRQASRGSTLDTFGLNITQDLLKLVAGTPGESHKSFAKRMAGSDGLMIAAHVRFEQLADKCKELLTAYQDTAYKERFGFIDHLRCERDPLMVGALNDVLMERLKNDETDGMHLAPPEPVDWHDLDGFTYSNRRDADIHADLDIDEYLACLDEDRDISMALLKRSRIGVRYGSAAQSDDRWSVYDAIVLETEYKGRFYVLTCGDWYEIEKDFVRRVNKRVKSLVNTQIALPAAYTDENEGAYNTRVAKQNGLALVDKKCVRIGGTPIEPCDLFSKNRQFIHVKRKTRSATLSHLFAQGTISADCFISDISFRKAFKKIVFSHCPDTAKEIPDGRPATSDFEVVYAIVNGSNTNWPVSLPFFSRLNLMNAADHLERLNYKISLLRIDEEDKD